MWSYKYQKKGKTKEGIGTLKYKVFKQGFSQMGAQSSSGQPLFKEYCYVFPMLLDKLFI